MNKIIRGLLYEKGNDEPSLGRVVLWILLFVCMHKWYTVPYNEFPLSLENAFMYTLAYNLFKKGVQVARTYVGSKTETELGKPEVGGDQ